MTSLHATAKIETMKQLLMFRSILHRGTYSLASKLDILRSRYAIRGPLWLLSRILKKVGYLTGWILFLPLTLTLHTMGYRRVLIFMDRIGHLACETAGFLMEQELGMLPKHKKWFLVALPGRVCNPCLLAYWEKYISVMRHPLAALLLDIMTSRIFMRHDVARFVIPKDNTSVLFRLWKEWGSRPPLLSLTADHRARGRAVLKSFGMPDDAWFVCFHVREAGYSPIDEMHMDFRNASPANLIPAMQEVIKHGGWCVRVGDASGVALPPMPQTIDYPRTPVKSDWMDIYLAADCRMFVGSNSGLIFVATVFGRNVAMANTAPPSILAPRPGDISIPKLMRRIGETRYMTFGQMLNSDVANYQQSTGYKRDGIELIENEPEDIRDLIVEMLDPRTNKYSPEDEDLQSAYMALFHNGHYSYGAGSRLGAAFLRKHKDLLKRS